MPKLTWGYYDKPATLEKVKACVGPGWHPLLESLVSDLLYLGWDGEIFQVKEKFGGLRFYAGGLNAACEKRIHQAEDLSLKTCEECGQPGNPRPVRGWITTLCDNHAWEDQKEK